MLLKSVDQVSLGCGNVSVSFLTEMCGCPQLSLEGWAAFP